MTFALGITATLTLGCIPLAVGLIRRRVDIFEPATLMGAFYVVGFPIAALLQQRYGRQFDVSGSALWFPKTLEVAALGMAAWLAAYYVPRRRLALRLFTASLDTLDLRKLGGAIGAFATAGWTAHMLRITEGGYLHASCTTISPAWWTTVGWMELFLPIAISISLAVFLSLRQRGERGKTLLCWGALSVVLISSEVLYTILSGSRAELLSTMLVLLATTAYIRGRMPWVSVLMAAVIAVFGIFPIMNIYRQYLGAEITNSTISQCRTRLQTILTATKEMFGISHNVDHTTYLPSGRALVPAVLREDWHGGIRVTINRLNMIGIVAPIIRWTPSKYAFLYGKTFASTMSSFLPPRFLIRKPKVSIGGVAFAHMYHLTDPRDTMTSVAPTRLGELYWNFGEIGVLLGMAAEGFISRSVYATLVEIEPRSPAGIAAYNLFLLAFLQFAAFADYALPAKAAVVLISALIWARRR